MKFENNPTHFSYGKNSSPSLSKSVAIPIVILFLLITIPLYLYDTSPNSLLKSLASNKSNKSIPIYENNLLSLDIYSINLSVNTGKKSNEECDIFKGEWVADPEGPYYTNETKCLIDDRQNCMKNGRPDTEFLKWRWKPDECELARFNATNYLEILRGKTLGFLGDSVARNQMESLVCLLASAVSPVDVSNTLDGRFKRWLYADYNFTIVSLYSPYLVKANNTDPPFSDTIKLYLDQPDEKWTAQIETVNILIVSSGQWFFRAFMYYEKGELVGCYKCNINDTNSLPYYAYKMAFRAAFDALLSNKNFNGVTFLRTFSNDHFENGDYKHGGSCERKVPFRKQERELEWYNMEFYRTQVEEFRVAENKGVERGLKFKLLDTTKLMFLRPDGHPNIYGRWANMSTPPDCVHWCLPGPVDTWNEFLYHMLKIEVA